MNGDFRVGPWVVEPSLNSISCKGTTVRLEPKVMEVLICLARHAGETLPKETLFDTVWPNTFVTDDVLKHAISELRRAFEDDAREPRIILTIPKRGYRLVAPVNASGATGTPTASLARDSIVVLPFVNMSAEPESEYFADGITEEIINALAHIEQLHVAARSSAFSFKHKHVDLHIVGERLNVRTVLTGSVRRAGSRLRVTVQLVNVSDGYHIWSERYDLEIKDIFEVQDEIARSIVERLRISLEGKREEPLVRAGTKNLEAYQLYLKGRAMLYQRGPAILRGLNYFQRAVTLDSEYALAWAGLADSYTTIGYYGLIRPEESISNGTEAARRSVALDPSLAEAHNSLGMCCLLHEWDLPTAEQEFLCALKLNPRYIQAHCWYALFYLQLAAGRMAEGIEHTRIAVEFDPLSGYANAMLGMTHSAAGRYSEAVEICERAVELDPDSYLARCSLQWALRFSQRYEDAVAACKSALAMSGRHPWAMGSLAIILAEWGKRADAESVYAEMMARARHEYMAPAELAVAASAVGMQDEAICHAREAFEVRDPFCRIHFSKYWPDTARLREDPRFQEILLKYKLD